jgi:hypothetical protein
MKTIELGKGFVALVDDCDYERVRRWDWHASMMSGYRYATRSEGPRNNSKRILMHRQILCALPVETIDHKNHDTLDNQRLNLRISTDSQNAGNRIMSSANTSGFKGVCYDRRAGRWKALIQRNGKLLNIGNYKNKLDAAKAYDVEAVKFFGEFAFTNSMMGLL